MEPEGSFSHLCLGITSGHLPSDLSSKIACAFHISPMRAKFPAYRISDLITVIVFG
jgi:hypothetical protein